ncbi:MAG: hypothetical protein H9882_05045 [Candidatus Fournierella pullistercoris]|uniref:Uncharacterized protein n=1 Tax=Candidatus Allofournierella pullistercoris TaxID=2838597 RepID=A0A948T2W4_9FIRM|nr:hypothetical protein [Candidatus Fournierella pullistercoris]
MTRQAQSFATGKVAFSCECSVGFVIVSPFFHVVRALGQNSLARQRDKHGIFLCALNQIFAPASPSKKAEIVLAGTCGILANPGWNRQTAFQAGFLAYLFEFQQNLFMIFSNLSKWHFFVCFLSYPHSQNQKDKFHR